MEKNYAYFYKVLKNMEIDEIRKDSMIRKHECEFDEAVCKHGVEENYFSENLLGWIELIENEKLYEAVKNLPIEDQIFISYIVKEGKTQRELAKTYGIRHQNISKKFERITQKIKEFL